MAVWRATEISSLVQVIMMTSANFSEEEIISADANVVT